MRNKNKTQTFSPHPPPFFPGSDSLMTFLPPPHRATQGHGECNWFITLCLCCPFLLMLFLCSSMASLSWDTILHELLQHGSFPRGTVLQVWTAPASVCYRPQFLLGAYSSMSSPWSVTSFRTHLPAGAFVPPWATGWMSSRR